MHHLKLMYAYLKLVNTYKRYIFNCYNVDSNILSINYNTTCDMHCGHWPCAHAPNECIRL